MGSPRRAASYRMAVLGLLTALVVSGGVGCEAERKELPKEVKVGPSTRLVTEPPVPAATPPEVKNFLERAVAAVTANQPQRLQQARVSRATGEGTMLRPEGPDAPVTVRAKTRRDLRAVWPDRLRLDYESDPPHPFSLSFILNGESLWSIANRQPVPLTEPVYLEEARTDGLAQHWLPLIFPLLEPGVVAYDLRESDGQVVRYLLRCKFPNRPVYQLAFDAQTLLLRHVEYRLSLAAARPMQREWDFDDFQTFSGLKLPTRMSYAETIDNPRVREVKMEWQIHWEFPATIAEEIFQPPATPGQPPQKK